LVTSALTSSSSSNIIGENATNKNSSGNGSNGSSASNGNDHTCSGVFCAEKALHLSAIKRQVRCIMDQMCMRAWRCLLPTAYYPLPQRLLQRMDPSTLTGRCLFSPTEDDLLLKGVMALGEANWEAVRAAYMPSKEAQLLQFRYTQMTSLTAATEGNNFKM
jgi:hypothetical protein